MSYHPDFASLGLEEIARRFSGADLIPSQVPLRDGLEAKIRALRSAGIGTLEDLVRVLRAKGGPAGIAARTGISEDYLVVLRRTVEAFRPKPVRLRDYPGVDPGTVEALEASGIRESPEIWEAARGDRGAALASRTELPVGRIEELLRLADLSRIPYVGATYARAILEAGYGGVGEVARADPEALDAAIQEANVRLNLYKTRIGPRDIRRLIRMAGEVEDSTAT
jgi:hypothetical protein